MKRLLLLAAPYFVVVSALFIGVLLASDSNGDDAQVGVVFFASLGVLSLALGVLANHWAAPILASTVFAAALAVDLLWWAGVIDRSEEYEPFPLAFVVVFWDFWLMPAVALTLALGVALRRGAVRLRRPTT
jgi:hypothetical protein